MHYFNPPTPGNRELLLEPPASATAGCRSPWARSSSALLTAGLLVMGTRMASAAVFTFDDLAVNTSLSAVPDWTTSSPDPLPGSPLAWVADTGTSKVGAIGGYYDAPPGATYAATVANPLPILTSGQFYSEVTLDLAIIDSTNTYPDRDRFGFSVNDSTGSPTISVDFRPVAQTATPATLVGLWEVIYTVRGGVAVNTTVSLAEGTGYSFKVAYQASGIALSFGSSALENTFTAIPTTYLPATQSITGVSLTWTKSTGPAAYGDNYLVVDNIAVAVPEPSAFLASSLAGLALVFRRRRHHRSAVASA